MLKFLLSASLLVLLLGAACGDDDAKSDAKSKAGQIETAASGGDKNGAASPSAAASAAAPATATLTPAVVVGATATPTRAAAGSTPSASPTTGGGTPAAIKSACALFTKADAAAALGTPAEEPKIESEGDAGGVRVSICGSASTSDVLKAVTVQLRISNKTLATTNYDALKSIVRKAQELPGLGDKAYYDPETSRVQLLKGDAEISIEAGSAAEQNATAPETLKALAKKIADRY